MSAARSAGDLQAAGARAVVVQDAVFLDFQKPLVEGDALGRRELAFDGGFEGFPGVLVERS